MRQPVAIAVLLLLLAGCVPEMPVRPEFGTSALRPTANIPPEFAAFNNYDPRVNALLADQICAVPFIPEVAKTAPAVPGELVSVIGRCETYAPFTAERNAGTAP